MKRYCKYNFFMLCFDNVYQINNSIRVKKMKYKIIIKKNTYNPLRL